MALLDWINDASGPVLKGPGVTLRPPRAVDHEPWAALRSASYAYLQPWEPLWPEDDLTRAALRSNGGWACPLRSPSRSKPPFFMLP